MFGEGNLCLPGLEVWSWGPTWPLLTPQVLIAGLQRKESSYHAHGEHGGLGALGMWQMEALPNLEPPQDGRVTGGMRRMGGGSELPALQFGGNPLSSGGETHSHSKEGFSTCPGTKLLARKMPLRSPA